MRKAIALIMVFLCLACIAPVNAVGSSEQEVRNAINETLSLIEPEKAAYGLGAANFGNLAIGSPVTAYEYKNGGYSKLNFTLYPLLNGSNLMAFAIVQKFGPGDVTAQIDVELSREINAKNLMNKELAIVYDEDTCYAATDDGFVFLSNFISDRNDRDKLNALNSYHQTLNTISRSKITNLFPLGYSQYTANKANNYSILRSTSMLDVPIVTQNTTTTNKICWACCVSSIGKYLTSYTYSHIYVARALHGDNYNQGADIGEAMLMLLNLFGVQYYYTNGAPSHTTIYNIITTGYPIYSSWYSSGLDSGHAMVIRGTTQSGQSISVMDPSNSNYTALGYSSTLGTFVYTSGGYNYTIRSYGAFNA